jgi:hypothetical protein
MINARWELTRKRSRRFCNKLKSEFIFCRSILRRYLILLRHHRGSEKRGLGGMFGGGAAAESSSSRAFTGNGELQDLYLDTVSKVTS